MNKKQIEIYLSKLSNIEDKNISLEQYQIEGDLAAEFLLFVYEGINCKIVADLGCGNGILGIGALLLGAKKVYFIDIDNKSIYIAMKNCSKLDNAEFFNIDINKFNTRVDTVVMNPPFGVQNRKADKNFLLKAFEITENIYSIHKIGSEKFIEKICQENNFKVVNIIKKKFLIKKSYKFHTKAKYYADVGFWKIKKN